MLLLLRHAAAAALSIVEDETALLCQRVVAVKQEGFSASLRHDFGLGTCCDDEQRAD
jgi:hypothetical protein